VHTLLATLRERIRESYWFIPSAMGLGAFLLAVVSLALEGKVTSSWLSSFGWVYTRDAEGARQLLSMIGGSLITVTGVVFSVTLVALTNASSQFGSRVLRTFARDTGNKVVLGAFLGTFLYCLLVMRTITGGNNGFVPHFAVLVGIALSMVSFGLLIYFIHHVISIVQADNVITAISHDLNATIARMFPSQLGSPADNLSSSTVSSLLGQPAEVVTAPISGYLESIDDAALLKCAAKGNLTIEIVCSPGEFVFCGSKVALIRPPRGPEVREDLQKAFSIAKERSYVQDIGFAFQQLVLVATRSLSPAINDQLLAMTCIDRLCESLALIGERQLPCRYRMDEDGNVRIVAPSFRYTEIVRMALALISEVASDSAAVISHILYSIGRTISVVDVPELQSALVSYAGELHLRALQSLTTEVDRRTVEGAYRNAIPSLPKVA